MHEEAIFADALMKAPGAERQAFLAEACGGDVALRQRLEQLLAADGQAGGVLERGPDVAVLNPAPPEPPLAADRVFAGRFKLREKLGEGGMGEVWVADQTEPVRRRVALKVVRSGLDSARLLARFDQERQALALMDHPNIAKVLDAGVDEAGRPYFAMELIEGVPITKYCDEARLSPEQRLELVLSVCHAVQHAHQKGVIHRDLKPSNLLVALYDGRPIPKVIDFGVAKATGPRLTEHSIDTEVGSLIGTLEYMSPEQAELNNLDIDTRADIYSLGVVLYELLTGTVPFPRRELQGAPFTEMLRIIREAEPPKPSTRLRKDEGGRMKDEKKAHAGSFSSFILHPSSFQELDWIVLKCLEKDRARRYQTANGLARDIERYLHEEPVEAGPPSGVYRLRKFARRNRKLLTAAAAFGLLLASGAGVSIWQAVRATAAERQALTALAGEAQQRTQAEKSAKESAAVLKFFRNRVLAAPRPKDQEGGLGKEVTIRAALDKAEPEIAKVFADQPVVEASVRHTLAQSYSHLGELGSAVRQQERALALYRQELGPEHSDTLGAMNNLAIMRMGQGQREAGLALFEELVQLDRRVLGPEDPSTLRSMNNLANALWSLKRFVEARKLYEEVLPLQRRIQGPHDPGTLRSMNNLASVLRDQGQREEARKLFEETLQLQRHFLSPKHPETLATMNNLAIVLEEQEQFAEARKLFDEALQVQQDILGPTHPDALTTMHNLAILAKAQGQWEEARRRFEETLRLKRSHLRPGHPETLRTVYELAWLLATAADAKVRDPQRALELAKEMVEHDPGAGNQWTVLGAAYYRVGEWNKAIAALEKYDAAAPGHVISLNGFFLAMAHWQLGEKEKARQWYNKAVGWRDKKQPADRELLRFGAEASTLLGLRDTEGPGKKDGK